MTASKQLPEGGIGKSGFSASQEALIALTWHDQFIQSLPKPATGLFIVGSQAAQQQKTARFYNTHQVVQSVKVKQITH